jgi:CRISPR-associated protein Cas2
MARRVRQLVKYRIVWLFVFFDLPVVTKKERKLASKFRKDLLKDGFTMMQYSVYNRHCASWQSAQVHIKRIKDSIPKYGQVSIIQITDKQYGDIINYWGQKTSELQPTPPQLELF